MGRRLLLYSDNPPVGGVPQFNHSLLCKLAEAGYDVSAAQIRQAGPQVEREQSLGIHHYWLDPELVSGFDRSFDDLYTPLDVLLSSQPELILFSDGWPLGNFAAKQVASYLGIPFLAVVGFVDGKCTQFTRENGLNYAELMVNYYQQAQAVVAVSQQNLDILQQLYQVGDQGKVIHYGRPHNYFELPERTTRQTIRETLQIPSDAVVCFTSARLAPIKGFDLQLAAIQQLQSLPVWEKLYFLWAGSGYKDENIGPELQDQVEQLGVADRVKFLGERRDIPDLLAASDIYILPSRAEGMPLAIMEAMAKGLPIMASAVSGIPEELGETGQLLPDPNQDPAATVTTLVTTLQAWVEDAELRSRMSQACRQRAEEMFTEARMHQDYLTLIADTCDALPVTSVQQTDVLSCDRKAALDRQVSYASLVRQAWARHNEGDLSGSIAALNAALEDTPFLRTETLLHWIESFARLSDGRGESFDAYDVCRLPEWQQFVQHRETSTR
ncbi:MAG: glycosyltransferase family 4 protein [Cyanobacteria bacterium P01_A01_bin.17]